jgi:hypothetical protein
MGHLQNRIRNLEINDEFMPHSDRTNFWVESGL